MDIMTEPHKFEKWKQQKCRQRKTESNGNYELQGERNGVYAKLRREQHTADKIRAGKRQDQKQRFRHAAGHAEQNCC